MADKPRVLFVDDNANLLNAIKRVLRKQADLVTAESGDEALKILASEGEFSVLVSDQNMPNMKGDALLAEAASRWPHTVRVMLTGTDDQVTAAAAVNTGKVFRFVRKPCEPEALVEVIEAAAEHHRTITAEKRLLEQTLAGSVRILSDVLATLRPDLYQRAARVRKGAKLVAAKLPVQNAWELDLAAMLYPLGLVLMPDPVAQKYLADEQLLPVERQMINQSTEVAAKLINNIPRLKNVADGIAMSQKGYDGSGFPVGGVQGKKIPKISRILRILIDLVDAASTSEVSLENAGNVLKKNAAVYDPELLESIVQIITASMSTAQEETSSEMEVKPAQLKLGDIIVKDILDSAGKLLLAAGSELTEVTIQRIKNLEESASIASVIVVSREEQASK